ncbi:DUF2937 family protein [Mesobacterium sp. TK19101]|uniref:DUF2937 family protein n=1 Tax=Mesobacterium hydrothermale TaxID=3111907 RepID=A0ABU6HLC8_9RHOB|nr:DUF2937 family protein [Mesobacterium sp. TK19101]MEC3863254.1 DUF2937 family protein [Mesobacterium sp. TK19101]
MILRSLTVAAGLTGAAGLSQFPEFSQQYLQRLGGAVDELTVVVTAFDADARAAGLTRQEALADLNSGGTFAQSRSASMQATFDRHARLTADLAALQGAGPFTRLKLLGHLDDSDIARRAWGAYKPALPITFEGVSFAIAGFAVGALLLWAMIRTVKALFRPFARRKVVAHS